MYKRKRRFAPLRQWIASVLIAQLVLGPLATPAYAALTPLADEPLAVKSSAKPNIVLTVDDSTSMLFDFLPDYVIGTVDSGGNVVNTFCRDATGKMAAACGNAGSAVDLTSYPGGTRGRFLSPGWIYSQYGVPYSAYASAYDASGPGAGCDLAAPRCSGGIDPGSPTPGVALYPGTSPAAGKPYEYWLMWPAPPHNSALNRIYYNPTIMYDPPVYDDGTSYPQMNAANTANWTQVPADPWAVPVANVDLTANVTVGQWCNSDWTQGTNPATSKPFATDPAYCRQNGLVAAAASGAPAADGDYTYPWAWPGGSASKDAKYFYPRNTPNVSGTTPNPNDNILWCDTTSPAWPQTGPATIPQTCNGYGTHAQTCVGATPQTCGGGTAQTCQGATPQTCNGYQPQTCSNITLPQTCLGSQAQTCNNIVAQTCNGSQNQTCANITAQTCNGYQTQACNNITAQTCNGYQTQTCANITTVCTPPPPSSCTTTLVPAGCGGPEGPVCTPVTTCPPDTCVTSGKCSITNATCTAANEATACAPINGSCSITGAACQPANAATQCPGEGHCSVSNALCTSANASSVCTAINGTCSITGATCQPANAASQCPATGKCSISNAACTAANAGTVCTPTNGTCSKTGVACTQANAATQCPNTGNCSVSNATCTSNAQCPTINGGCSLTGVACTAANQASKCPVQGKCSVTGAYCTAANSATNCPAINGTCSITGVTCTTANAATKCPDQGGHCSIQTAVACTAANAATQCLNQNMKCSITGASCTAANAATKCPDQGGHCSIQTAVACTAANAGTNCPPQVTNGACSVTGAACQGAGQGNCPNVNAPATNATCGNVTYNAGIPTTTTLLDDANGAGVVCRRNNQAYAGVAAGRFNYPSGKYVTAVTGGSGASACTPTPSYTMVPRHYWKTSVEWCDKYIATAGDKWLGYGTDAGGTCQPGKDATHIYPRFFQFGAASYVDNYSAPAFERVDLDITKRATATYTHTWIDVTGQTQTITRNFDQEMTNYANWFAYYRTRIQAVKTVTSLTFTNLDNQYRVGFHTLSNGSPTSAAQSDPATFVNVADFDATQKAAWFAQLFGVKIPLGLETPTLDAVSRIGEYFLNGGSAQLSGSTDPIILSCQKNWHMLFTDGFTNQSSLPALAVADQDDTVPALPEPASGLTPGQPWPHPFREDPSAKASNAASDYTMKYWVTDLRTGGPNASDNVPATTKDPASWQHLNFAAMSLGTQGKLPVANQSLTENLLAAGALQWPQPYPTVYKPDNSGVDDLWHAAINGRGRFVNAGSAAELKLGMGQILQDITNQAGSRAGVGLASTSISLSNHAVYRVTFQPGWAGTLTKIDIDPVTGSENPVPVWEASTQLSNQLTILPPPNDTPWFTNRKIFTTNDSDAAVPFLWGNLSSAQQDSLAPGLPAIGQAVLEYLRGNPTNEGVSAGQFRVRATGASGENFLGDIVDSQAVYVGPPSEPYLDANDPGYSNFVASMSARAKRVYVGSNDAMLHAFDDATGDEAWAYIPHDLYRPDNTGLGALAYQDGALPPFRHHYYVDSTPRVVDVNFGGGSGDWHSLLVGGLGKGGKSYYALDVTNPGAVTDESSAAAQYLWMFTDADMGYSYGRPTIAKTRAFGGSWLAIVPAGYNNPTGAGKIFFIDAKTGIKVKEMSTGFGTSTSPSGLAQIAAYTKDFHNQLVEQIYGGDLYGNFWRFDVSDPNPGNWTVDLMASFTDLGGNPQPVTTAPQIEVDIANGVDRWVFIGTGRLLDESDITDTTIADQQQTFYAIRDGTTTTPSPITAALDPRTDFVALTDKLNGLSAKPAKGWYDDLPAGQRIVTGVQAALGVVAYVGTSPQDNPCLTGLPATLYVREFAQGDSLLTDAGGNPVTGISEVQGAVGLDVAIFTDSTGPQSASSLDIRIAVTTGTTGDVLFQRVKLPAVLAAHRIFWRLLGQ